MRYGVDAEISLEDLAELIAASTILLPREKHHNGHLSDFQWCGRRGGTRHAEALRHELVQRPLPQAVGGGSQPRTWPAW
jgi:hypothetical protein